MASSLLQGQRAQKSYSRVPSHLGAFLPPDLAQSTPNLAAKQRKEKQKSSEDAKMAKTYLLKVRRRSDDRVPCQRTCWLLGVFFGFFAVPTLSHI